ncbi:MULTISPECIES: DNA-3-methyladenine glycosylase [Methanocalculus]|uniref:DNA-3-methyladenine glycosylase family protein n=1 Tax=Methanocalculus TaxID=71151 RepID=UPI00209D8BF2|nr:DNA glycosylase [Methanocalculus sp. MSAO_Arc1]MCP1663054.1 N-glycosylase/DNA lyase [Methanocalculus sp. AMF5]
MSYRSLLLEGDALPFNLDRTLLCGQVFRWEKTGQWWTGILADNVVHIRQDGRELHFTGTTGEEITRYFDLDRDLEAILASFPDHPILNLAVDHARGLRVIRQPAWECTASYIVATFANIPGIQTRIRLLCERFGDEVAPGRHAFPSPRSLAASPLCDIRDCRVGYRDRYLCNTAMMITENPAWEREIWDLPYQEARKKLLAYPGVGKKVADCILLFAFHHFEAVPVDVWIERIMQQHFLTRDLRLPYDRIADAARDIFGPYAGYAQEYLFAARDIIPKK